MSKRAASDYTVKPLKVTRVTNVWNIIPNEEKEFKPVEGGPKIKLNKTFVLNVNPRTEVTINLNGCLPEVRFASPDGCFYLTGDEFLNISGSPQSTRSLDRVHLDPTDEDGFRLARYRPTESGMLELLPLSVLELNKFAAKRLKTKLEVMCEHVTALKESGDVFRVMADCVADVYRAEYELSNTLIPIEDQFTELSRLVETYVPPAVMVKAFVEKLHERRLLSKFNYYNICGVVCSQKHMLLDLLKCN